MVTRKLGSPRAVTKHTPHEIGGSGEDEFTQMPGSASDPRQLWYPFGTHLPRQRKTATPESGRFPRRSGVFGGVPNGT